MRTPQIYLFAAFVSCLFCSCRSTDLLRATFESDTLNDPPATNLAGPPEGDVIQYNPAIENQLVVESSTTAGEKALHFRNAALSGDLSGHSKWVSFRGINSDLANTVWFWYTAANTGATGNVLVDVSDGNAHLIARMRIKPNGEVGLARNILDADYSDVLGMLNGTSHTIVFTTDVSRLRYNVTIFQTGGETIPPATDRTMITENALHFSNPARPSLSFMHNGNANSNHKYIIESVVISRRRPD